MRLRRLSEYGSVAYLAERPTRETQARTVLGHRLMGLSRFVRDFPDFAREGWFGDFPDLCSFSAF